MIAWFAFGHGFWQHWFLNAAVLAAVAILMVSRVPTLSIKRLRLRPDQIVPTLAVAGLAMALLVTEPWLTLSILALLYVASLPVSVLVAARMRREEAVAGAVTAAAAPSEAPATEPAAANVGKDRVVPFEPRQGRP
jgi:CDP-diacylglycerol--serine O-phosphatidyltransferase